MLNTASLIGAFNENDDVMVLVLSYLSTWEPTLTTYPSPLGAKVTASTWNPGSMSPVKSNVCNNENVVESQNLTCN